VIRAFVFLSAFTQEDENVSSDRGGRDVQERPVRQVAHDARPSCESGPGASSRRREARGAESSWVRHKNKHKSLGHEVIRAFVFLSAFTQEDENVSSDRGGRDVQERPGAAGRARRAT